MMMKREGPYRHVHLVYTYHVVIQFRVHRLTWHEGRIPRSGSSFVETRAASRYATPTPPVLFEAPDSFTNLKVAIPGSGGQPSV